MNRAYPSKLDQIPTLPTDQLQGWLDVIAPPRDGDPRISRQPLPGEVAALLERARVLGVTLDQRPERRQFAARP